MQLQQISNKTTLRELQRDFGVTQVRSPDFFPEWHTALPSLSGSEIQALDHIRENFLTQIEGGQLSENLVKMIILSPLLDLAGFYGRRFSVRDEVGVEISAMDADEAIVYRGTIDVLVLDERFWVLVMESKHTNFSILKAIPQCLAYLLSSPNGDRPVYGLITNGNNFRFLKLCQTHPPEYALSDEWVLDRGTDFEQVLKILKAIAAII